MTAFIGGFWQFFIPTHLLVVGALGLLTGQVRLPKTLWAAFAFGLAAGSLVVASAIRETPSGLALLVIAVIAATLVIVGRRPAWAAGLLVGAAGVTIAVNAPPQAITLPAAIAEQTGTALGALATFVGVTLIAMAMTRPWQRIGLRIVGSWIAASAILVLALRLAR